MTKRIPLPALVLVLALALSTLSCGEPTHRTATGGVSGMAQATRVSCIDVGKGDCILVQTGPANVLIDTGYRSTVGAVLSHLAEQGVGHLDALVLTHYDRDHVGGLKAIAESLDVDMVYLPSYEGADKNYETTMGTVDDLGIAARTVSEELVLGLGEARLVIYPSGVDYVSDANGDEGNDNDASLVLALTCGDDSYLFAGDLEEDGIEAYLRGGRGHFDVLKMPHHGEKSSQTDELIEAVQPKIVLVTDVADDLADKKTLKMLEKSGADIYRTSMEGTIVTESDGTGSYEVSS